MQNNSEIELKVDLNDICEQLLFVMEEIFMNTPTGTCYLMGNCLAEGLANAGLVAKEVTGSLILKDTNGRNVVYGAKRFGGTNVGNYHTWCEVEYDDETLIIDPSVRFNRKYLKAHSVKLNQKTPDIIISNAHNTWLHSYYPDLRLVAQSKHYLDMVDEDVVEHLKTVIHVRALQQLALLEFGI